ncbi:MAG TPA: hypothetical protein VF618_18860 [Thermoanaerobaculia bacterium]
MMRGEPAAGPDIPHPTSFSLPYVESGEWFACGPPPGTRQGWKLYVPLTLLNAHRILERVVPVVREAGLHFKYVRDMKLLRKLNAGMFGYTQIGKCFVIYLPEPRPEFLAALKKALAPFRDDCPAVPCARPFGSRLPLYYRYGAYRDDRLEIGGAVRPDNRAEAVPEGVQDLLAPYTKRVRDDPAVRRFLGRFPAFEALTQQGKGGIFVALNIESETYEEVILKVGYHRGQVQVDGSDGLTFLRRELAFYRELQARGLDALAPRLVDAIDTPRKVILALERLPGSHLLSRRLAGTLTVGQLERCWSLMRQLHEGGVFLGDAKIANFMATEDDDVRVLDFEAAGVLGETPPSICTFFVHPKPADPRLADLAHFLASVLYPYENGRYSWGDRHVDLRAWQAAEPPSETAAWAIEKLREVLPHEAPARVAVGVAVGER